MPIFIGHHSTEQPWKIDDKPSRLDISAWSEAKAVALSRGAGQAQQGPTFFLKKGVSPPISLTKHIGYNKSHPWVFSLANFCKDFPYYKLESTTNLTTAKFRPHTNLGPTRNRIHTHYKCIMESFKDWKQRNHASFIMRWEDIKWNHKSRYRGWPLVHEQVGQQHQQHNKSNFGGSNLPMVGILWTF
jgi:hypothetical protein